MSKVHLLPKTSRPSKAAINGLWLIDCDNLNELPHPILDCKVTTDIAAIEDMERIPYCQDTLRFRETAAKYKGVEVYRQQLTFTIDEDSPEIQKAIDRYTKGRWAAVVRDRYKRYRLLGIEEHRTISFVATERSATDGADLVGYRVQITSSSCDRSPWYEGVVPQEF